MRILGIDYGDSRVGIAVNDLLGLTAQAVTDWRAGRSKSYTKYLPQIAAYFGVSIEYFLE